MKKEREGKLIGSFEGHTDGINCLAMASDESILVSGSEDCTARIWDLTEKPILVDENDQPIEDPDEEEQERCLGVLE